MDTTKMKPDHQSTLVRAISLAIFFHLTLFSAAGAIADVEVTVEMVEATGSEVEVPISIRGAARLEGIQFVLVYDPQALENIDVAAGPLAGAADINLKEREPGRIRVAVLPESALEGAEGIFLLAKFKILAGAGKEVQIGMEEAKACEFREQFPMWMQVTTTSGGVRTLAEVTVGTPRLWLGIIVAAIFASLLLFFIRQKSVS